MRADGYYSLFIIAETFIMERFGNSCGSNIIMNIFITKINNFALAS